MSMRKVTFPSNYYSSLYADDNLLDFVITFRNNGGIVSTGLINAYTVVGSKMQNIKAAFVNYFDYTASNYNKGKFECNILRNQNPYDVKNRRRSITHLKSRSDSNRRLL
jgi:hypothetical protein